MFKVIDINYSKIDGVMSESTVGYHYGKHYSTYVNNLNGLVEGTEFESKSIDYLIENFDKVPTEKKQGIINNGGGMLNHELFFSQYSTNPKENPENELLSSIEKSFESLDNMKALLKDAGLKRFGSGWVFLIKENDKLLIETTQNQDNPTMLNNKNVILGIDVWEHSYYLDYANDRGSYLTEAINKIDWKVIEDRYTK